MNFDIILFVIFGALGIASAIGTIASKNPIGSAVALIFHFFMLAGLYLTLKAQFLAAMQIIVYAGAIMALVLFVIMLLNVGKEKGKQETFNWRKITAGAVAFALAIQLGASFLVTSSSFTKLSDKALSNGTVETIGQELFTKYLFPFEAVSLLLLSAVVGAVLLAKKKVE